MKEFNEVFSQVRQMTFDEIFESRVDLFLDDNSKFSESQINFLNSIYNQGKSNGLTKKQMQVFIDTVDAVHFSRNRKDRYFIKSLNHERI